MKKFFSTNRFAAMLFLSGSITLFSTSANAQQQTSANQNVPPRTNSSNGVGGNQQTDRSGADAKTLRRIVREVRSELGSLPYYDVFDYLEFEVRPDYTVVLRGQTVRPTLKRSAERLVEDIEGVTRVDNQIEVLPLSPNDDRIRVAMYNELFNQNSPLFRYSLGAVPPIRIIVKNGRVTLKGIVANEADRNLANIRARTVPGVFEVTNELQVERRDDEKR